jgi:hypothetical protein
MEIHKIKDDGKIERETNLDRRGPSQIGTVWHIPDPPTFSLPTTFKGSDQWEGRGFGRIPNHYMLVGEVVLDVFLSF